MADLLTKSSAPSDPLILAVSSGTVPGADTNPPFRSTLMPFHRCIILLKLPQSTTETVLCQIVHDRAENYHDD
eukprot:3968302-Amphidinium_carterae.1